MFQNTLSVPSSGCANKKNDWDETARVFIQIKIWFKRSRGQSFGRKDRQGHVQVEELAVEGNGPKWMPVVRQVCNGQMAPCQGEENEPWNDCDPTTVLQEAVSFI
jgi:hypothetical protein